MSLKHYGIYLAYPPTVDLRAEGLGRHLAMFLKGAANISGVRFTIICPSWTVETLESLFESEQVPNGVFTVLAPEGKPYVLTIFQAFRSYRASVKRRFGYLSLAAVMAAKFREKVWRRTTTHAVKVHHVGAAIIFVANLLLLTPIFLLVLPLVLFVYIWRIAGLAIKYRFGGYFANLQSMTKKINNFLLMPYNEKWIMQLFDSMHAEEMRRMQKKIDMLDDVRAWYSPTAFWPEFHGINGPRLTCVPDVVLSDFPVGFSQVGGDRFLKTFETIGATIRGGEYFVTYSDAVKWQTLVDRYNVSAEKISVIPHAPNVLDEHVNIVGFSDIDATSTNYCQMLFRGALQRSANPEYTATFSNGDVKFLFYASQLRPNKNVLTLLRAFEYLLRRKYIGHKLVLTGNPALMPDVQRFIVDHRLERDVIVLHGLSVAELAACYKLADLAVNPTLSEGGCPFTFTEALSVGTPVVMSRIAVAEEVLTDQDLQSVTFFDPFSWHDCAERIVWAIKHRDDLLAIQRKTYSRLVDRSWTDVVSEYVAVLDDISIKWRSKNEINNIG